MEIEQAIRILDPETSVDALVEIEYYAGFYGKQARLEAVNDACKLACEIMARYKDLCD